MGGKIARYLNQLTVGNVFDAPEVLEAYSTDRSALKIKPKFVALPESTDDIRKLMKFFYQLASKKIEVPIAIRGSGLDEMGADLSNGLVISTEKLNRLLEVDSRERLVRVQSGITLKELNTALSINHLTIPIGGHELETIGGLISNCPSDDYSGKYGGIMNYVERAEIVLPNGDIIQTGRISTHSAARKSQEKTLEGEIYSKLIKLTKDKEVFLNDLKKTNNGSAGYPTITEAKIKQTIDLLPLFFGAQGTLGVISEVILRAVPLPKTTQRAVATFEDFVIAQKFLDLANSLKPKELNLYDVGIIRSAESTGKRLGTITQKMKSGFVVYAKFDKNSKRSIKKINSIKKVLPKSTQLIVDSPKDKIVLDELSNSLISFIKHCRTGERVPILTDFYIPATNLARFIDDLKILEYNLGLDLAIYGSYSASNYHLRPRFDVSEKDFNKKAATLLKTGAYIINRQGGSLTGGAPEGRVKAIVTNSELTEAEKKVYQEIKKIFDKYNILGSQVKLGADARFTLTHFRSSSSAKIMI